MNQQSIFRPIIIGVLIAVLLMPVPAQALKARPGTHLQDSPSEGSSLPRDPCRQSGLTSPKLGGSRSGATRLGFAASESSASCQVDALNGGPRGRIARPA